MKRTKQGFTLAETLVTVGILMVLVAVADVSIVQYMRSLHQLEMDGIAKEIFVAAQNHLTMADSQGLLRVAPAQLGTRGNAEGDGEQDVYYFVTGAEGSYPGQSATGTVLDRMLPFASVDDTARMGGSYVIRYQPSQARVLDVFYNSRTGRFSGTFTPEEYATLVNGYTGEGHRSDRRDYNGAAIGWYGGEKAAELERGKALEPPVVEVLNAERLTVRVINANAASPTGSEEDKIILRLVVTGDTSGAKKYFDLIVDGAARGDGGSSEFSIVLDDVTKQGQASLLWDAGRQSNNHFAEVFAKEGLAPGETKSFCPGENLSLQAIAFNNRVLTNVAESGVVHTNSLFAALDEGTGTARVSNIRHLENLHYAISGFQNSFGPLTGGVTVTDVKQTADLDWNRFMADIRGVTPGDSGSYGYGVQIATLEGEATQMNCYMPVNMVGLCYDGQGNRISNLTTDYDGPAGVFGTLEDCELSNITVYNSLTKQEDALQLSGREAVGGLVGKMTGGRLSGCGAAVYVRSTGAAGGLIGEAENVGVENSYSGGHTENGQYQDRDTGAARWNVQGTVAGGLAGKVNGGWVNHCYATASAMGTTAAGGLAGEINAQRISGAAVINDNYATGRVKGGAEQASVGSFAAVLNSADILGGGDNGNRCFGIINEGVDPVPGTVTGIGSIDDDLNTYNRYYPAAQSCPALPYDKPALTDYYQGRYPLLDVTGIGVHYGDWPMPETFVVNQ